MAYLFSAWPMPLIVLAMGLPLFCMVIRLSTTSSTLFRGLLLICGVAQLTAGLAVLVMPNALNRPISFGGTLWALQLDQTAGFWLLLCGCMVGLISLGAPLALQRHQQALLLLAIVCTVGAAVQDDLLWLLMLTSSCGWLCIAVHPGNEHSQHAEQRAGQYDLMRWCGLFVLADLLAIAGTQLLLSSMPHLHLSRLQDSQLWMRLADREPALLNSAASLLWGMLVIRLGLYPGIGWLKSAATSTTATLIVTTLLFPLNQLIWFRLLPLLQLAPEARLMSAGLAAISVVLLGFLACFHHPVESHDGETRARQQQPSRRCLLYLAAGWNALICLGTIASKDPSLSGFILLLTAASGGLGLVALLQQQPGSRLLAGLAGAAIATSLPGLALCLTSTMQPHDLPALEASLAWLTGLGQLLLWCGLFRLIFLNQQQHRSANRTFTVSFFAGLIAWALAWNSLPLPASLHVRMETLLGAIAIPAIALALIKLLLGKGAPDAGSPEHFHSLSRLATREFYLDDILEQAVGYPMWCLQLVLTFLADGLFLRGIPAATRALEAASGESLDELDEPASQSMHWEVVLLTTVAVAFAVWIMG